MEFFWNELCKQIGPIPTTVQVALEQTKFIHAGLVYLDDATIDYVEADIRRLPVLLNKSEKEVATLLDYKGHLREFRFLAGERCVIKLIAQKIRESGFLTFFKPQPKATTDTSTTAGPDVITDATTTSTTTTTMAPVILNPVDVMAEVRAKIYSYYDQRRENYEAEEPFFERLSDLEVDIRRDHLGDVARVICPFCDPQFPSTVMIRRDKPGTWKVSNFSGHIKSKHDDLCIPGKETFGREGARKRTYREANASEYVEEEHYDTITDPIVKVEL
ncbi:uncharacterized protein LOC135712214 [Ochlerotatus camptorhynchus]|uniref:uncharacterized protein LOC135712214 n=1 Tax=Ochlerotatus camptorhynchus TaxID=644619 RepID=UPI0031DF8053